MTDSTDGKPHRRQPEDKTLSSLSLLLLDQQERWQRGECPMAEAYLEHHPSLREQIGDLLTLIYHEVVLRERRGEHPTAAEYEMRFPQFADDIRQQFEIHDALSMSSLHPPEASTPPVLPTAPPGYEILNVLGRGGTAVVYKARQLTLGRTVALKMILGGEDAQPEERARFRAEAQAIASLKHPNIVQIHEVIEHEGRLFLALEFVDGGSLARHVKGTPLPAMLAVDLVEQLARAMHFVHQKGIVHRDLKPANILVQKDEYETLTDRKTKSSNSDFVANSPAFSPKITDFGLAKWLWEDGPGRTRTGDLLGTPSYMAPEQIDGPRERVGPATDIYGLGGILYELLTGRPPFVGQTALATLQQVRDNEPVSPTRLEPSCPRDLATIVLKCLEKMPANRYASAAELADDLRRFRDGLPIAARPARRVEQIVKWARRRPAVAALLASVLLLAYGGGGIVIYLWLTTAGALNDAELARAKADAALEVANAERAKTARALDDMKKERRKAEDTLAEKLLLLAQHDYSQSKVDEARKHLQAIPESYRAAPWRRLQSHVSADRGQLQVDERIHFMVFSPDSRYVAILTAGAVNNVLVWEHATGKVVLRWSAPPVCMGLFFHADSQQIGVVNLTDTPDLSKNEIFVQYLFFDGKLGKAMICPVVGNHHPQVLAEHRKVASTQILGPRRTNLIIWDLDSGAVRLHGEQPLVSHFHLSGDGAKFALVTNERSENDIWNCRIFDWQQQKPERQFRGDVPGGIAFSPDFRSFFAVQHRGGKDYALAVMYDAQTGKLKWEHKQQGQINGRQVSPDSKKMCLAGTERRVVLLDANTGEELLGLRGHPHKVTQVRFSPDGRWLVSADLEHQVRVWAIDGDGK